jgi:nicotinate phosphoribosyltransferase
LARQLVDSLLDNDFYNFTMGQLVYTCYPDREVTYKLTNRSTVALGDHIDLDELQEEIENTRSLKFTENELVFLEDTGIMGARYLDWLSEKFKLPQVNVFLKDDNRIELEYEADWKSAIFWETPLLAIVNHLYHRDKVLIPETIGLHAIKHKITRLAANPRVKFVEFGTRRRFSADWQRFVLQMLMRSVPEQVIGTSNVNMARFFGLPPVGTMAHQLFMVLGAEAVGTGKGLEWAQKHVLDLWDELYGHREQMMTALPDTWGTEFFFSNVGPEFYHKYKRVRHDSGVPSRFADFMLGFWYGSGVDAKECTIIFSDGLTIDSMIKLANKYGDLTNVVFGWGTNLTCDVGSAPLSLVIKPYTVNGYECVKLSDNIAKAIGSREEVLRYMQLANHSGLFYEQPKY